MEGVAKNDLAKAFDDFLVNPTGTETAGPKKVTNFWVENSSKKGILSMISQSNPPSAAEAARDFESKSNDNQDDTQPIWDDSALDKNIDSAFFELLSNEVTLYLKNYLKIILNKIILVR